MAVSDDAQRLYTNARPAGHGERATLLVESRTRQPTLDGNVQLLLLEECSFFTHTHKHGGAAKRERSKDLPGDEREWLL